MSDHDTLLDDLARLGRGVRCPDPRPAWRPQCSSESRPADAGPAEPSPGGCDASPTESRTWGRVAATATVASWPCCVALLATPPVRAAVADWFGFAGVMVEQGPDRGDDAPPPPPVEDAVSVAEAAELVGFAPGARRAGRARRRRGLRRPRDGVAGLVDRRGAGAARPVRRPARLPDRQDVPGRVLRQRRRHGRPLVRASRTRSSSSTRRAGPAPSRRGSPDTR